VSAYRRLLLPLLSRMDAEVAHDRTLALLAMADGYAPARVMLRALAGPCPSRPVTAFGLAFPNVLGVAAGFDKNVTAAGGLALLGFGHVEAGTLTPLPQPGNPKPRVFRLLEQQALINRMGFPNCGVEAALPRLRALSGRRSGFVLGVSLGKQKDTPVEEAARDYAAGMRAVYPYADYLAINVSSPNTPDLRSLQLDRLLTSLLAELAAESRTLAARHGIAPRPLLVKVAPDLSWAELDGLMEAAAGSGVAGLIATNTTVSREGVKGPHSGEAGGLSGRPLGRRSSEVIAHIRARSSLPVIGVGGVLDADDVRAKLDAGAALVQVYAGLVYEGPAMAGRILRDLAR
jgi:dihydroorotate dehydrogenase